MSSAQSPAPPKPAVPRVLALAPRPPSVGSGASGASGRSAGAVALRESSGRRVDVGTLADDLRCGCGRLLAKVVAGGLEIRCTRCKASHVLAWSEVDGAESLLGAAAGASAGHRHPGSTVPAPDTSADAPDDP